MEPERWQQVDRVFEAALELPAEQRGSFLDRECAGDEELRHEVEALLAHDRGDSFLEGGGSSEAAQLLVEGVRESLVGRRVGRFEVEARLGAGGMGEVYRARDPLLGRPVALKVIPAHLHDDPERRRRFRREALATSALNHPNIVTVYEIVELEERDVLVTELVDGVTLRERMTGGAQPAAAALEIALQIARGLAAAHAVGVVHRDVKPENVVVRRDGLVKLLDFGIAKSLSLAPSQTETGPGEVVGTPTYMSPEQARGLAVDARTDVWSLGVILYEMLTGEPPFRGASPTDTLAAILTREPDPPSRCREELPPELDRIAARALAKNREERHTDGAALAADLERALDTVNGAAAAEAAGDQRRSGIAPAGGRRGFRAAVAAVVFAVAASTAGAVWYARATAESSIDSLAVMPLALSGGDPGLEYLSEGIAESLIRSLAEAKDLRVMSREASFRYREREMDAKRVARELGVRGVLTGRMTAREDGLSVSLELIDGRDDSHVWGAQYDEPMTGLASLHERIARDLQRGLHRRSDREQEARVARLHTDDARAYQLYLQGRFYWHRPRPADFHRSRDFFLRAIEIDPDYALAWAGLAHYYGRGAATGMLPPDEYWPRSQQAAQRALHLDPALPEAQTSAASSSIYWRREWAEGEQLMRRALEVFPEATSHFGLYLSLTGRADEGLALLRGGAAEHDPNAVRVNRTLAMSWFCIRRFEEAAEQARRTLEVDGTDVPSWELLGDALHLLGRHEEAVAAWRQSLLLEGQSDLARDVERAFAESGPDAAVATMGRGRLEALLARAARGEYVPAFQLARQSLRAGDLDSALDWAVTAFDERNRLALEMLSDPVFDPLRAEPRFVAAVRSLGLPFEVGPTGPAAP